MFKYILAEGGNINWMSLFALVTFFALFVVVVTLLFFRDKLFYQRMSNLPLDTNDKTTVSNEK